MKPDQNAEILAPAGTMEALTAAVRCGTNAVYLGGKLLNARRNAGNFEDEALRQAVRYCHGRGVKVYLTLNTLTKDQELRDAEHMLALSCDAGVDALIVQDLGVAKLARKCAPDIPLHASTQMSVQTPAGLEELAALGFSRAVIPRELSFAEIQEMAAHAPLELEMFIHGALCMCVSGQCYLSAMLGSRSGSRGLCAQPCRLPFAAPGGTGHDLSLKDLSLIDHIRELHTAGVRSFKIEGRMKRPEYVAAAVTACKQALEGGVAPVLASQLQAVFSRSGFTDGYFTGRRGRNMFGVRGREDVAAAAPVLRELARLYEKEQPLVGVSFSLCVRPGTPPTLAACARGAHVDVQAETPPEPARSRPLEKTAAARQLSKCGGTPFYAEKITCDIAPGLTMPAAQLNALRRAALDALALQLESRAGAPFQPVGQPQVPRHTAVQPPAWYARFADYTQLPADLSAYSGISLPLHTPAEQLRQLADSGLPLAVEIPRGLFGQKAVVRARLEAAKQAGVPAAVAHTLDGVHMAREAGLEIHGGFGLNLFNTAALLQAETLGLSLATLSFELTLAQAAALGGSLPRGLLAYGRFPLMLTRNCPLANGHSCAACGKGGAVTDRKGVSFPIRCTDGCSELFNSRPVYLADRLAEIQNIDYLLLYFTQETPEACASILAQYQRRAAPSGEYTRGLYYRGVE